MHPQYRELEIEDEEETNQHKSQELETIGGGKNVIKSKVFDQQSRGDVAFLQRGSVMDKQVTAQSISMNWKKKERPS